MKFVNLKSSLSEEKLIRNLKKEADYFSEGEDKFSQWSLSDYDKSQKGIHASYDSEKNKICAYFEDGIDHKNFLVPVTEIFSGKIKKKDNVTYIKGTINMSPIFTILLILVFAGLISMYIFLKEQRANVFIIGVIFFIYFIFVKKTYRDYMNRIVIYLNASISSGIKTKKNNPNKKKGKWAPR